MIPRDLRSRHGYEDCSQPGALAIKDDGANDRRSIERQNDRTSSRTGWLARPYLFVRADVGGKPVGLCHARQLLGRRRKCATHLIRYDHAVFERSPAISFRRAKSRGA